MNRSRPPRRAAARRGRSRESSPVRETDGAFLETLIEDSTSDPSQRRSTRSRRGTPTPPLGTTESRLADDDGDTGKADQRPSPAQHAQQKPEASKTKEEKEDTKKDASPPNGQSSPTSEVTADTGEQSQLEAPTVSQDAGAVKDDAGAAKGESEGDDRGTTEGEASIPNGNMAGRPNETASASPEPGAGNVDVPQPAIRRDSRTISLGSKSAMEVVDVGGNDHAEPAKVAASPSVSLDSRNESPNELNDAAGECAELKVNDDSTSLNATESANNKSPTLVGGETVPEDTPHDTSTSIESVSRSYEQGSGNATTGHKARSSGIEEGVALSAILPTAGISRYSKGDGGTKASNILTKTDPSIHDGVGSSSIPASNKPSSPRLEKAVSHPAVVSNAFAIDIRPTAKNAKVRRLPQGAMLETPQSSIAVAPVTQPGRENAVNVKDNIPRATSKRMLNDDRRSYKGEPNSQEARLQPKRQRTELSAAIMSSTVRRPRQRRRRPRNNRARNQVSNGNLSRAFSPANVDVESIKIRMYDIASRVHRGKGPEHRFAAYWGALSRFLSFQVQRDASPGGKSSLGNIHEALDSFLVTKQMRKLHNMLIMGLLAECTKESVGQSGLEAVPEGWRERTRTQSVDSFPANRDTDSSFALVSAPDTEISLDLTDFDQESDVWTATGREPLISLDCGEGKPTNALTSNREVEQVHRHSPCLPGALSIDPRVREIVRGESSLKVSETAVWLLIVSVRGYVQSLLKDTVSNLSSVDTEQSLEAVEFTQSATRSGNMGGGAEKNTEISDSGKKPAGKDKKAVPKKKRRISSLDIASALSGTRLSSRDSLGGSVSGVGYQRCCHVPLNGNQLSSVPTFGTVQSFIVDSIESASKKPKHEWRDPAPFPSPPDAPFVPSPATPRASDASPKKRTATSRSPTGGPRQEAAHLALLQARAAASKATSVQPSAVSTTVSRPPPAAAPVKAIASPAIPATPPPAATNATEHQAGSRERNITPPVTARPSPPPTISPRGRGKGFGVKDLAAMRARNTPPGKGTPPSPTPFEKEAKSDHGEQSTPVAAMKQNGAGKELRRLQEAEARKGNSPEANNTTAGASPNAIASPANTTTEAPTMPSPANPVEASVLSPPAVSANAMDTST